MRTLKLIVGLGRLAAQDEQNLLASNDSSSAGNRGDYHAVLISDDAQYQAPTIHQIVEPTTITIPKWVSADAEEHPIASLPKFISRRGLRQHFRQHQQLFWQTTHTVLQTEGVDKVQIVLLINTGDALASSICWDVLCQLRLDYPNAECYPVFFVPKTPQADEAVQLNVMTLLSEFNALGQKAWMPTDFDTQKSYEMGNIPFWSCSFLHELPEPNEVGFDYGQLIEQVTCLPQQKVGNTTLVQLLEEDFYQLHDKKRAMLPRLVSLNQSSMQLDMVAVQKLLTQSVQIRLMTLLANPSHCISGFKTNQDKLLTLGWVLNESTLLLNDGSEHETIDKEWQVRGDFFIKQVQAMQNLSWKDKASELSQLYQKAYEKHFRGQGVALYYSVSQSRLERLAESHGQVVEANIWKTCWQGECQLSDLAMVLPNLLDYYVSLTEQFELQQRRIQDAYFKQQALWDDTMRDWEQASRRERTRIEQKSLEELGAILKARYILQCQDKAFSFAIKLIDALLPTYQKIGVAITGMQTVWLKQTKSEETKLKTMVQEHQKTWISKQQKNGIHQYSLQPSANSAEHMLQICKINLNEWVFEILTTWLRRVGEQGQFKQLLGWLEQGQWMALVERISAQVSYRLATNMEQVGINPLSLMFEQRLTDLTQNQILQFSKHATESMTKYYQQQWQPLGQALSEYHKHNEVTAILCSLDFREPEAETAVLWMKEAAKRHSQNVMVVPMGQGHQIQIVSLVTGYLQEWRPLEHYLAVYQKHAQNETALWHMHVDGEDMQLQVSALQMGQRNLDLVRQQLLLAKILGYLKTKNQGFELILKAAASFEAMVYTSEAPNLAALVDTIPLAVVRHLMAQHRHLRDMTTPSIVEEWNWHLDQTLEELRKQYIPEGMDLAEMDWKEAGRYVVWTRSVQNLRKYWLPQNQTLSASSGA